MICFGESVVFGRGPVFDGIKLFGGTPVSM